MKGLILGGRRGHAAAADHPHEREAARARRQQADPASTGSRTWPRPGSARSASSSATPPTRSGPRSATAPDGASRSPTSPRTRRSGSRTACSSPRDFLGDDDFVMYLGDNMLQQGLTEFVERLRRSARGPRARTRPRRRSCSPRSTTRGSSAWPRSTATGEVVRLVEKPVDPPSDLALVGVYLFDRTIHDAVARHRAVAARRARDHRRDPVAPRPRPPRASTRCSQGWWIDTGKKDPLLESNRYILETLEPANHGTVDDDVEHRRPRRDRSRRRGQGLARPRARRSSASAP